MTRDDVFIANVLKCLRYSTPVQLADGSWERIGRLVRSRYDGEVMSVDTDGHVVPRQVKGWHASPVGGRRVYRLTYASAKTAGGRGRVSTQLTGDHQVLTERGYIRTDRLQPDDRIAIGQGLSKLAKDVICGTVLGDGHLSASSAHLFVSHCEAQAGYAEFKGDLLAELQPRIARARLKAVVGGPGPRDAVHLRTRAHRAVGLLRNEFYGQKRHVPKWMEHALNDRVLAFWFLDDGHLRVREGRRPIAEIASVAFTDEDREVLRRGLVWLGLPARVMRSRFHFDVPTTLKLLRADCLFCSTSYALQASPRCAAPYSSRSDATCGGSARGPRRGLRSTTCSSAAPRQPRPPARGDRDLPALAGDADRLIQPRVIGTLGNFATKLLTGEPDRDHQGPRDAPAPRARRAPVCVFPLFHPAAGLRTTGHRRPAPRGLQADPPAARAPASGVLTVGPAAHADDLLPLAVLALPREPRRRAGARRDGGLGAGPARRPRDRVARGLGLPDLLRGGRSTSIPTSRGCR